MFSADLRILWEGAMVRFIRYVLRALNPKTAVTMDSRQVFRIRRWTVACVLAILVIAMVSCSVHGMKAHAQRAAQASQSATTGKTTAAFQERCGCRTVERIARR